MQAEQLGWLIIVEEEAIHSKELLSLFPLRRFLRLTNPIALGHLARLASPASLWLSVKDLEAPDKGL